MEQDIFKKASTTYYCSSKFFPKNVRSDVFKLYSFVRVADDFVDNIPQDKERFLELKASWEGRHSSKHPTIQHVVANMEYLSEKYDLERSWVDAFLLSMEQDLDPPVYKKLEDSIDYVYGSADVVGFMMAKILGLEDKAMDAAGRQGRAMQWINFIRDIDEDIKLGRSYFPAEDFKKHGLKDLSRETAEKNPESFNKFIHLQIERYEQWQSEAEAGYKYIPKRLLIPVKTASDMYNWTAQQIEKDPFVVYQKKVKPRQLRVIRNITINSLR